MTYSFFLQTFVMYYRRMSMSTTTDAGITRNDFIAHSLKAMQGIADALGLKGKEL
jgi:hypothetical protein